MDLPSQFLTNYIATSHFQYKNIISRVTRLGNAVKMMIEIVEI